jgi:hypothetical protein
MPAISRLFLKTGIVYLVLSLLLFLLMQMPGSGFGLPWRPVFYHMLMVGWITQVIFGVAIWMFPRVDVHGRGSGLAEGTKGSMTAHYSTFALLNIGLLLRWLSEPILDGAWRLPEGYARLPGFDPEFLTASMSHISVWILLASGLMQLGAFLLFAHQIWPRIREKKAIPAKNRSTKRPPSKESSLSP